MRCLRTITAAVTIMIISFAVFMLCDRDVFAAGNAIRISSVTVPSHQYAGKGFCVNGNIKSSYKLIYVRCGVKTISGKWINGIYVTVNPKSKSFNLKSIDKLIPFGKLKAGKYVYRIEARSTKSSVKRLVSRKFTVSKITGKKISKPPASIVKGTAVTLTGKVKSKFRISKVFVGITTSAGKWKNGFYQFKTPKKKSFDISSVDHYIKFGRLGAGTYRYRVYAVDVYGKTKLVVNKQFKVVRTTSNTNSSVNASNGNISSRGFRLSYKSSVINAIGKQPVSGPCGQYAMAYCRAVIDGAFPLKSKYKSYYQQLYNEYGFGSHYAYWYKANGSAVWYSSCKTCYKAALKELAYGRPCIINLHNNSTGNNHFVALIGYVAGTNYSNVSLKSFIALDPGYGKLVYLKNMNYTNSGDPEAVFFN